jgi:DNA topoisomerase-1
VARVVREVADYLGNTPAFARTSYIDPRIIEVYERGSTIAPVLGELGATGEFGQLATQGQAESAVLRILARQAVRHCSTAQGHRLLKQWPTKPHRLP